MEILYSYQVVNAGARRPLGVDKGLTAALKASGLGLVVTTRNRAREVSPPP